MIGPVNPLQFKANTEGSCMFTNWYLEILQMWDLIGPLVYFDTALYN